MCNIKLITITDVTSSTGKVIGRQYIDSEIKFDRPESLNDAIECFFNELNKHVSDKSAVILYRSQVKRLADSLSDLDVSSKDIFTLLRKKLREKYQLERTRFNPRTMEFQGLEKAFIVRKFWYED